MYKMPSLSFCYLYRLLCSSQTVFQSIYQDVIYVLKKYFLNRLVQQFLKDMERNINAQPPSVNLLDAVHYLSAACDNVKHETIKNFIRKIGFTTNKSNARSEESDNLWIVASERILKRDHIRKVHLHT